MGPIWGLALDAADNLFIADPGNRRIRRVDAATGIISTVAGSARRGFSGDGGPATSAGMACFPILLGSALFSHSPEIQAVYSFARASRGYA